MQVDAIRSGNKTYYYLRHSVRKGKSVRKRTLANLSHLPKPAILAVKAILSGQQPLVLDSPDAVSIRRARQHGHAAACLGTLRRIGLERDIAREPSRSRDLVVALVVATLLGSRSKRHARLLIQEAEDPGEDVGALCFGEGLRLGAIGRDELYRALDWLEERQDGIEARLARRRLRDGSLVLYDVTSTYFEGRRCPLAARGHSRDHRGDRLQIVVGLLASADGCPVAVEVFPGNTGDPGTLSRQLDKVRGRFGVERVVWVGDRGLITSARIRKELRGADGLDWVSALRSEQIRALVRAGAVQPSLFDQRDLLEVASPDYPGERLVVCRNPRLAGERARKRRELLAATEKGLARLHARVHRERRPLRTVRAITAAATRILDQYRMGKHFRVEIDTDHFEFRRNEDSIATDAALDGFYVVRTSVPPTELSPEGAVIAYKRLARIETAFSRLKSHQLRLRPIRHHLETRVRAHVFLAMLAAHLEWHLRRALAPLLFQDEHPDDAEASRDSPVQPAQRSPGARRKAAAGVGAAGFPLLSLPALLDHLASLTWNDLELRSQPPVRFSKASEPTPLQKEAFRLLGLKTP